MNVLGVNCFSHDTAACLVQDGQVVAFVEEERFNREKHTTAFPDRAIEYCLGEGSLGIGDVDTVAFAHRAGTDFVRGALDALKRGAPKRLAVQTYVDWSLAKKERDFKRRWGYDGRTFNVGHHDAHAAAAFFASPFDEAAVLTLDRGGDFLSTTIQIGQGNRLRSLAEVRNPDSLGEVYTSLTWYLGFRPNADEGKVMGLAPYGRDRLVPELRDLLRLTPDGLFKVNLGWFAYHREGDRLSGRFLRRYGPPRVAESELTETHEDLAFAVQDLIEEAGLHITRTAHRMTGSKNLALAGGVALNSVMNTRLLHETEFEHIFIQPAASDAGNALGAALHVWHQELGQERAWSMRHAFWGPHVAPGEHKELLAARKLPFREVADPSAEAARLLSEGKIVGWFQGRA